MVVQPMYQEFTETTPSLKYIAGESGLTRYYNGIYCPTCMQVFCHLPSEQLRTSKANRVKKHIDSEHTWISLREDATETVDELEALRKENEHLVRENAKLKKRSEPPCEKDKKRIKALQSKRDELLDTIRVLHSDSSLSRHISFLKHTDKSDFKPGPVRHAMERFDALVSEALSR